LGKQVKRPNQASINFFNSRAPVSFQKQIAGFEAILANVHTDSDAMRTPKLRFVLALPSSASDHILSSFLIFAIFFG
jgi:hypothetical protein